MTTRTFQQRGLGYAAEPLSIIAKINGIVAYEGPVTTVDEPLPSSPETPEDWEKNVVLFSWTNTVDFEGTAAVEISVVGNGTLMISRSLANYSPKLSTNPEGQPIVVSSGPDEYLGFFYETINGVVYGDPFVDPTVDGVEVDRVRDLDPDAPLVGQWFYTINGGSVFTGTLRIQSGLELTETRSVEQ
jgi:hypothetical protein